MSRANQERREVIYHSIHENGLTVAGQGTFGGSAIWMRAADHINTHDLADQLRSKGVLIEPGAAFFDGPKPPQNYFRIAYSSIPSGRIATGINLIANALHNMGETNP
jgi:GntR family transcriptional regulator/MocR family aminotransferase